MGLHGEYHDVWSTDIVAQDPKVVFYMLEGSWFGNWDHTDNVMRSVLATPTMGLAVCCIAGHPHWYCHHVGLGEPIGYGARLSMNNSTLYRNQTNEMMRSVYMALMGDPTLRMEPIAPVSNVTAQGGSGSVAVHWSASLDATAGYYVYRAPSGAGPFSRVSPSLVAGTAFTDSGLAAGTYTYMVRAVALTANPSGSYYNPSQGVFVTVTVGTSPPPPVTVNVSRSGAAIRLSWNSQTGTLYRVWAASSLTQTNWADLSGPITANSISTSWTDSTANGAAQRFYRVSAQ
jgi:hypothetical protein